MAERKTGAVPQAMQGGGSRRSTVDGGEGNESPQGRPRLMGNPGEQARDRTQSRIILSANLTGVNEAAKRSRRLESQITQFKNINKLSRVLQARSENGAKEYIPATRQMMRRLSLSSYHLSDRRRLYRGGAAARRECRLLRGALTWRVPR